jgi:hypothetical protein
MAYSQPSGANSRATASAWSPVAACPTTSIMIRTGTCLFCLLRLVRTDRNQHTQPEAAMVERACGEFAAQAADARLARGENATVCCS